MVLCGQRDGVVGNAPDGLERRGIAGKPRDEVPVNVRHLVAQQAVVHFSGVKRLCQHFGEPADFFHHLDALGRRQVEQFRGVAFEDDHGPAGKELIVVEVGHRQSQIRDEVV